MPRLTKTLPKYRKHKASGQAVVTLAGRDIYLGPHGTKASKVEYDRAVAEWLAAGRPSYTIVDGGMRTLVEVIAAYLPYMQRRYMKNGIPTSEQERVRASLKPVTKLYGRKPAVEFGPLALKAVRIGMVEAGLARGTINQNINRIKRLFKWAASEELIPVTAYQALVTVTGLRKGESTAKETAPIQPVPDADVEATLPHLPPTIADMVRLQRLTGMRPGEIVRLRPCDVDRTGDVWHYQPMNHKTEHHERERVICIGPKAQQVISKYLLRAADTYCFSPGESEVSRNRSRREVRDSPMTPSQAARVPTRNRRRGPGASYAIGSYRTAIQRACRKNKVSVWSPNQLRHAAATEIRRLHGLEAAQVILGHAAADVTQVYAERDSRLADSVARRMG
jgi:integrase